MLDYAEEVTKGLCIVKKTGKKPVSAGVKKSFKKKYKEYLWQSYNAYSHEDSEILIEVTPKFVEIWDEDEARNAFQILIDFDTREVEVRPYD